MKHFNFLQKVSYDSLILQHFKNKFPATWIFFVTNKCNSHCKTCFYWREINKRKKELALWEIKKISNSMGNFSRLFISGGEPFLRDDLARICEVFIKQNDLKRLIIPTNGLLENKIIYQIKKITKNAPDVHVSINVSIDGMREINDSIRGRNSFLKSVNTLSKLYDLKNDFSNLNIVVNTVVCNKNYKDVQRLSKFLQTKYKGIWHSVVPLRDGWRSGDIKKVNKETLKKTFLISEACIHYYISEKYGKTKADIYHILVHGFGELMEGANRRKKLPFKCFAGKHIGVLEPDGGIKLCEEKHYLGNIRDYNYDISALWFSKDARLAREKVKDCYCTHGCFTFPSFRSSFPSFMSSPLVLTRAVYKGLRRQRYVP